MTCLEKDLLDDNLLSVNCWSCCKLLGDRRTGWGTTYSAGDPMDWVCLGEGPRGVMIYWAEVPLNPLHSSTPCPQHPAFQHLALNVVPSTRCLLPSRALLPPQHPALHQHKPSSRPTWGLPQVRCPFKSYLPEDQAQGFLRKRCRG